MTLDYHSSTEFSLFSLYYINSLSVQMLNNNCNVSSSPGESQQAELVVVVHSSGFWVREWVVES
jgi:hypothetical protein